MKKTLHGKRHLRSRASVQVGRIKRAERKMERMVFYYNSIDWVGISQKMVSAFFEMAESMRGLQESFVTIISSMIEKYHTVKENLDGSYTHEWNLPQ